MMRLDRDVIIAVLLLLFSGTFFAATFSIRETSYATLGSEVWPRSVVVFLFVASVVYLITSLRSARSETGREAPARGGIGGFYATYRNPLWCFITFAVFLVTLPYFGMLIGGILFVFATLTLLGGWTLRSLLVHGAIAFCTVGAMWALFTFGLGVILPEGEILRIW